MPVEALRSAHRLLEEAIDALSEAAGQESVSDDELLSVLTLCEGMTRRIDRLVVDVGITIGTARGVRGAGLPQHRRRSG